MWYTLEKLKEFFIDLKNVFSAIGEDLSYYVKLDPASTSKSHVFFFNASFHGLLLYRFSHFFHKWKVKFLANFLHLLGRILYSMDIHPSAEIEPGVVIDHGIGVVIGETAKVGKSTLIYHGVTLGSKSVMKGKRHPDIGRNVLLGAGAKILGPIKVGDNAIVGANAVVLEDVPSNVVVVGIPAKIVKVRGGSEHDGKVDRENTACEIGEDRSENILEA